LINIDGGLDYEHLHDCVINGANVFATGIHTVFQQEDGIVSACKRFEEAVHKSAQSKQ